MLPFLALLSLNLLLNLAVLIVVNRRVKNTGMLAFVEILEENVSALTLLCHKALKYKLVVALPVQVSELVVVEIRVEKISDLQSQFRH